jgi:hypothetical protein
MNLKKSYLALSTAWFFKNISGGQAIIIQNPSVHYNDPAYHVRLTCDIDDADVKKSTANGKTDLCPPKPNSVIGRYQRPHLSTTPSFGQ